MRNLKIDDKGEDVKNLQRLLNANGFSLTVDGHFGQNTDKAIREFQKKRGLKIDGIVGVKTLEMLGEKVTSALITTSSKKGKPTQQEIDLTLVSTVKKYSLKKDGEIQLSKDYKVKDFACKDGSDMIYIDSNLVIILQKISDHFGVKARIMSGYRTLSHNTGADRSLHMWGQASDITVPGKTPKEVAQYASTINVKGICYYTRPKGGWTHVDTRIDKWFAHDNNGKVTKLTSFT